MTTTSTYVQMIERQYSATTGKEVADLLGVAEMSVSRYRNGSKGFADDVAIRAASLLGLDPEQILIELHEERAETPETRQIWRQLRERLSAVRQNQG